MKTNNEGEILEGSPGSEVRILGAIKGLNKMFYQELGLSYAYGYLDSCEFGPEDQDLRAAIIGCSEYRTIIAKLKANL